MDNEYNEYEEEPLILLTDQKEQFFYTKKWGASRGGQGCQPAGSLVLMADGSWREIQDVQGGDVVFSPQLDGSVIPATVSKTYAYEDCPIYEVYTTGKYHKYAYRCSGQHLLPTIYVKRWWDYPEGRGNGSKHTRVQAYGNALQELTVEEFVGKSKRFKHGARLFFTSAYELPERKFSIHPYVLGVLIGDGCLKWGNCTVTGHLDDAAVIERMRACGETISLPTVKRHTDVASYSMTVNFADRIRSLGLRSCGAHEKFIPGEYKKGSIQQRLELLAGLIDTDGTAHEFASVSLRLINDFADIVRSVGGVVSVAERWTRAAPDGELFHSYRAQFTFGEYIPEMALARKHPKPRDFGWKNNRNRQFNVRPLGREKVYGFTVESPSQWYVTNDFIVTHNSGKALSVDTPTLTPDGYRRIGDLEPEDLVIGSNGRATHVTGVFPQGMLPGFRVVFSGGVSVVCSDDHLWHVQDGGGAWRTLPLSFLRESILTEQARYRWTLPKFMDTRQRKIIGVSPIGDVEMVCISVEASDGLFVLSDGIVTHNTTSWCYWLWLQRMEQYPESNFMAVGATYQQLRDGFFKNFVDALWAKGLAEDVDFIYRANPRPWLRFKHNGAKIHSWSADIVSRVRGANVQTLIVEEPQTWGPRGEEAWISLSGRLRHNERTQVLYPDLQPQGRISFNPTKVSPGHWLYDMLETRWPEDGYKCWQMSTRRNSLIGGHEEYVRNLEMSMAPSRWGVEIDGNYDTAGGSLYRDYNPAKHHIESYPSELLPQSLPLFQMDPFRPIFWSLDFNVEWQASVILQYMEQRTWDIYEPQPPPLQPKRKTVPLVPDWQVRLCYVFDEIFIQDKGTRDVAEEFLNRYGAEARTRGVRLYGDASGGGRSQQLSSRESARTNWQTIIEELVKGGVPLSKIEFCVQSSNPAQTDRVNNVNSQFVTGAGIGFILSAKKCPNLLNDFRKVVNKPGTNEIFKPMGTSATPDQLKLTHLSDALGYCITMERKRAAGEQVKILDWRSR